VLLSAVFVASAVLIAVGGVGLFAPDRFRGAGVALIGLGVLLLILALVSTANYNA
jgi:hypothetical protein